MHLYAYSINQNAELSPCKRRENIKGIYIKMYWPCSECIRVLHPFQMHPFTIFSTSIDAIMIVLLERPTTYWTSKNFPLFLLICEQWEQWPPEVTWSSEYRGPISQTVYKLTTEILWTLFCSGFHLNGPVRSAFCTCHDSWAVVICAKLWPDMIIILITRPSLIPRRLDYDLENSWWNGPAPSLNNGGVKVNPGVSDRVCFSMAFIFEKIAQ